MPKTADKTTLNPMALTPETAARLLHAAGARHVTVETIQSDISAGAPVAADGTINLMHYAAWRNQRENDGEA